jgi:hypothetical protein
MRSHLLSALAFLAVSSTGVLQGADGAAVAHWGFDGNLRDQSGWGHDLTVKDAHFVPGHQGQALQFGRESVEVPSCPELELAPGLKIDCWVKLSQLPTSYKSLVRKDHEYMLRVDPISEGGQFSLFVYLNGSWEPRVSCGKAVKTGVWYHVVAGWTGKESTLEVNGEKASISRAGVARPTAFPLEFGALNGVLDELRIENPIMRNPRASNADMVVADWPFDGSLMDRSGRKHGVTLPGARFVPGHDGQALFVGAEPGQVESAPDLCVAPGLRIECWVFLKEESTDYRPIVFKDGEYLLRVDSKPEGGHFAFFVKQNGKWDPKVRSKEPAKTGVWYHLMAQWDGTYSTLEVDGATTRLLRSRAISPGDSPVEIGSEGLLIDALRIENATALAQQGLRGMIAAVPAGKRTHADHFGEGVGWPGWVGAMGASLSLTEEALNATFPDSAAMVVNPALDLDLTGRNYICCDISCRTARTASLMFVTDTGYGTVSLPIWAEPRTSVVDLSAVPSWKGKLKLLAIAVPGIRSHEVKLENLWVSAEPVGKPFLKVRNVAQGRALLRVGRPETLTAVIENLGMAAGDASARIELPSGVRSVGNAVCELGAMPAGAVKTAAWTFVADSDVSDWSTVVLTAKGAAPSSERCKLIFRPAEKAWEPDVRVAKDAGAYYIDSVAGDNANSGRSVDSPWRDFTNINGTTLGPGEKLLIKRGSVINQELQVSAHGTADNWTEIGPYGVGARPIIRRNWDIQDRCALILDPDYLWIHGLTVSCAAKGLIVCYKSSGHAGLLIEDCIASHIEGLYLPDNHGIPEWRGKPGPRSYGGRSSGIAIIGAAGRDMMLRDCEMFHTSQGFRVSQSGKPMVIDRVFCHSCYAHNTCPHPILIGGDLVTNSIFDASGGHASRGTMGIMLGGPRGLTFRNCVFRNMPDSGSHDQGGVDFEAGGDGCLIDGCTFENNAGAGIEVLGLRSPQCKNIEIRNSRFIKNNWVKKSHGPAEIYVWGKGKNSDPTVCCSTGTIHNNGYVLNDGVEFFINAVPDLTWWKLWDNVRYANPAELRKAMPFNDPPVVDAGPDLYTSGNTIRLVGTVKDDGRPAGKTPKARWDVLEGPGLVTFTNEKATTTTATFAQPGDYLLRLIGDDGEFWLSDMVSVHVLPKGASVATAWEFNQQLDKQGWTEGDLGTRDWKTGSKGYDIAKPVKYVSGGYYIVAVEDSTDAHLLSPDDLALALGDHTSIAIRFQNSTPATSMRFAFTTDTETAWSDANSKSFQVVPNDNGPRTYVVDMSTVPAWRGKLKQLRLDIGTGKPVTGTCRIDYIRIDNVSASPAR